MSLWTLQTGSRICARVDHYPARAGATGRVLFVRQGLLYVVVEWERPHENFAPVARTELTLRDLAHFEVL